MAGVVIQRRGYGADAGQVDIANGGAASSANLGAQLAQWVGLVQQGTLGGCRGGQLLRQQAIDLGLIVHERKKGPPRGRPQHGHDRTHAHIHRHGQAGLFKAHDDRAQIAHDRHKAGHLQALTQMQQGWLGNANRVVLAHGRQPYANGLTTECVLCATTVLLHQALGHQTGQIAVHLGRAFIHRRANRREAGAPAQIGQRLENGQTSLGRLHTLAALTPFCGGRFRRFCAD